MPAEPSTSRELSALAERVLAPDSPARVVVLGDLMLDRYLRGAVERVSPEAPVPVVHLRSETSAPGGAGNVARNLRRLGAEVTLLGCVGADAEGRELEGLLVAEGVTICLRALPGWPTTTKTRVVAGGQQVVRVDREEPLVLPATARSALLDGVREQLALGAAALIVSDYAKGTVDDVLCAGAIAAARAAAIPVIVDPKGVSWGKYRGATCVCPNTQELARIVPFAPLDLEAMVAAARALVTELGLEFMALTRGEHGIALVGADSVHHEPSVARQVFDVSGAGDTVVAVLALALAAGAPPPLAARLANLAAGVVVGKVGTAPVEAAELLTAVDEACSSGAARVMERAQAQRRVAAWRARGERVAFTNGCFDALHAGHIASLRGARAMADRLVVGLNSDESVRRLKGPDRPLVSGAHRAICLAALACVDLVVEFGEDTPRDLIEALHPDLLVKGDDYRVEDIAGADLVLGWGGEVALVPRVPGLSTTALARG